MARAQAQLDTAMVMTFGAVAASKLPPKRRPRLDPRVLDSLLNGTACEFCRCKQLCAANTLLAKYVVSGVDLPPPPTTHDVQPAHVATHWGPTAAPGKVPKQFMEPSGPPPGGADQPMVFKAPFERKR